MVHRVGATYGGAFGGAGDPLGNANTVYSATQAAATNCPNRLVGARGRDVIANGQIYNPIGSHTVQVTASATVGGSAWADFQPNFGGMGVGTGSEGIDTNDHINGTNVLRLVFATPVTITGIGTLFHFGNHGDSGFSGRFLPS